MFKEKLDHEKVKAIHQPREKTREKLDNPKAKGLSTTLNEFIPTAEKPWDKKRAAHVIRRLSFGLHYNDLDTALLMTPSQFIDSMIDAALNAEMPAAPEWENKYPPGWGASDEEVIQYFSENFDLYIEYQTEWTALMKAHPFREKMVLFWHNHFVTEIGKYELAPYAYRHFSILRNNALGNVKDFVREIGLDQAMLIYLDGVENRAESPNENYARELLELFTMGIGNYTQTDIEEIARALTGYWVNYFDFSVNFAAEIHDAGEKTFFGRTGNYDYNDVIDIIFEEREQEIAEYICTKIYKFFVYETPNEAIVSELAQLLINENFEIEPVVRTLLKSEHFFDDEIMGAMIKSPIELMLGLQIEVGEGLNEDLLSWQPWQLLNLGQFLFSPVNVAGWPGHRAWISTTTLPFRWQYSAIHAYAASIDPVSIAKAMSNPNDPYQLVEDLAEYMLAVDLPQADKDALPGVLLGGIPDYEWSVDAGGAKWRILSLMSHIRQLPAYQLK
ncbi:MAG: DUF1800 domain-containing protein [Balneola sp.]|nr:MAG: DUF1800 domain-containing protein [Balneola sp.]